MFFELFLGFGPGVFHINMFPNTPCNLDRADRLAFFLPNADQVGQGSTMQFYKPKLRRLKTAGRG